MSYEVTKGPRIAEEDLGGGEAPVFLQTYIFVINLFSVTIRPWIFIPYQGRSYEFFGGGILGRNSSRGGGGGKVLEKASSW